MSISATATATAGLKLAAVHVQEGAAVAVTAVSARLQEGAAFVMSRSVLAAGFLTDFNACLPPGFASPLTKVLGWIKAVALLLGLIAMWGIGRSFMKQQGDGMPDRDETTNKLYGWAVAIFIISFAGSMMSALGMNINATC